MMMRMRRRRKRRTHSIQRRRKRRNHSIRRVILLAAPGRGEREEEEGIKSSAVNEDS